MIANKNSVNCYHLEKQNSIKEKRHLPKRNTAMQCKVKPVKDVIYPKIWLPKFISSTALHNIKAINYPPVVLNNFLFHTSERMHKYLLRITSESVNALRQLQLVITHNAFVNGN